MRRRDDMKHEIPVRNIWSEPLTENEEQIIERVVNNGTEDERRRWLGHCLRMLVAQREEK